MNHLEDDVLLDVVHRVSVPADARLHLETCPHCQDELQSMERLSAAGSRLDPGPDEGGLVTPPAGVWDRIQSDLVAPAPTPPPATTNRRRPVRLPAVAAAAAALGLVVGGLGVHLVDGADSPSSKPTGPVRVAEGRLVPFDGSTVSGRVEVEQINTDRVLTAVFKEPTRGSGYVEAWLLDPETNEMIGLGVIGPSGGTVTVPSGTDLDTFTTVDISREQLDGNPAHSDESIARGTLRRS